MSGRPQGHADVHSTRGLVGLIDAGGAKWQADRAVLRPSAALRVRRTAAAAAGGVAPVVDVFLAVLYRREGAGEVCDVALFPGDFGGVAAGDVPAAALVAVGPAPLPLEVRDWLLLLFASVGWWRRMGREGPRVFAAAELGMGLGVDAPGGAA